MSEYSDGIRYSENEALEESKAIKEIMEKDQTVSYSQAADKLRRESIETKPGKDNDVDHTLLEIMRIEDQHRLIDRVEVMGFHPNINLVMLFLRGNNTYLQQPLPERFEHEIFNVNLEYDKILQSIKEYKQQDPLIAKLRSYSELSNLEPLDVIREASSKSIITDLEVEEFLSRIKTFQQNPDYRERLHHWQELAHTVTTDIVEFYDSCLDHASLDELVAKRSEYLQEVEKCNQMIADGDTSPYRQKTKHDWELWVERLSRHIKNKELE